MKVKLTPSQQGALMTRKDGLDPLTLKSWQGPWLVFSRLEAEELMSELIEASNAEDAQAELLRSQGEADAARYAARDSRVLGNVASGIVKALRGK